VILALGDSLTAGFGLAEEESFPARLQTRLEAGGYAHRVVNAGVSGDTTAGGLSRLDWLMRQHPNIIILALGANDGLRGVKPRAMRANLAAIIEQAQAAGARVLLAGMRLPSNYGADYTRRFEGVFRELATQYNLPLLPFLLEGVALRRELNQADGIHPNVRGTAIVTDNVWRALEPLLEK
jgi:acyl-CoA thioesterase-1